MSSLINDTVRLNFLSKACLNYLFWNKEKNLWFLMNKNDKFPFSTDSSVRGAIDRAIDLNNKNCYNYYRDELGRSILISEPDDTILLDFLDLKLFNLVWYDSSVSHWRIGCSESSVPVVSNTDLRKAIGSLLGIGGPKFHLSFN